MTSTSRFGWTRLPVLAAGFSVAIAFSATAQTSPWPVAPAAQEIAKDTAKCTPADDAEAAADEAD